MRGLYVISHATIEDADTIARLHAQSWRSAYRGILPDSFLDASLDLDRQLHWRARMSAAGKAKPLILKAVDDGAVYGFACVFPGHDATRGALLDNLHVRPGFTGRGLGARLLAAARSAVAEHNPAEPLHLWVFEANTHAVGFYERQGGCAIGTRVITMGGVQVPELCFWWPPAPSGRSGPTG